MPDALVDPKSLLNKVARRLSDYGAFEAEDFAAVAGLSGEALTCPRGTDLTDRADQGPHIVLSGWACQMRLHAERRQIFSFFMPGDIVGSFWRRPEFAFCRIVALTRLRTIPTKPLFAASDVGDLRHRRVIDAARRAEDHAQHRLFDHMVRLGGRDAYSGLAHLLLELHTRMCEVGLADAAGFQLPLGQRVLAQALGFSVAHVNHTLQRLIGDGLLEVDGGAIRLLQPGRMAALADFRTADFVALPARLPMEGHQQ